MLMNKPNDAAVIRQAKKMLSKTNDAFQGTPHAKGVLLATKEIMKYHPEANKRAVIIAAWWHDVGRLYQQENHEKLSAELVAKELSKHNYEKSFIETVYNAIEPHGLLMHPKTIEGKIIRDADKLNYISIARWRRVLNSIEYINNIAGSKKTLLNFRDRILRLGDSILELDISKQIYAYKFPKFKKYISKAAKL